jgi:AAA+ superfamily predicted ATPase
MGVDPSVLSALEASLAGSEPTDPGTVPVRLHLASLYLAAGQSGNGLAHAQTVLQIQPDDTTALSLAAACASAAGNDDLAEHLRRRQMQLLDGTPPGQQAQPGPAGTPISPGREVGSEAGRSAADHGLRDDAWDSTDPRRVTLADVAGLEDVKARLHRSLLAPMANLGLREAFRKQLRGGLLLWGPPGTGKTFVARALSGEMGAGFLTATPADIYGTYFSDGERNIARLFRTARQRGPIVVFLDELDALGGRRSARTTDQARGVVNQLLSELDGTESNADVFILGATNAPWDVDDALRRPGRFDRTVLVLPPDEAARRTLLSAELADLPTGDGLDLTRVVKSTETYSGADLGGIVTKASERALARSVNLGSVSPITNEDLIAALADTPASTHTWLNTAATYVAASCVDDDDFSRLRDYLRRHRLGR